jgi:YCII-related domain-containing protein
MVKDTSILQKRNPMKKFLVLYRMDMAEMQKMMSSTSAEERKKSMGEWEVWMKKNMASFADHGGPVGKTKQVAASGAIDTKNDIGGYSIVQAESQEAAAALFADNPHLTMPGATVEVMEIMPMPGR